MCTCANNHTGNDHMICFQLLLAMDGPPEFVRLIHSEVPDKDLAHLVTQYQQFVLVVDTETDEPNITVRYLQPLRVCRGQGR